MQLPDALDALGLEGRRGGGEVGVLVAEELVADLPRQQHPDIALPADGPAEQVHTHAGADGGDVVGTQDLNQFIQGVQHVLLRDIDFVVIAADVVRCLPGVFQVDGVGGHAHGVGLNGPAQKAGGDGADQGAVQPAGEKESHWHIGVQPLFHAQNQLLVDVGTDRIQVVPADLVHLGNIPVAGEPAVLVVVARREGQDSVRQPPQVFRLAGKEDLAAGAVAVVQGPDADGVPGGDEAVCARVIEDEGEFRVQLTEHPHAVLPPQGQEQLTVGPAGEHVPLGFQLSFQGAEPIELPVADHGATVRGGEGLHPRGVDAHDRQAVEEERTGRCFQGAAVVGAPAFGGRKAAQQRGGWNVLCRITHNCTHKKHLRTNRRH